MPTALELPAGAPPAIPVVVIEDAAKAADLAAKPSGAGGGDLVLVFAHNEAAQGLYRRAGMQVSEMTMGKELQGVASAE